MQRFSFSVALIISVAFCGSTFGQGSDDCATPQVIAAAPGTTTVSIDNTAATDSVPAPVSTCSGTGTFGDGVSDVWYSWTAPDDGTLSVSTCNLMPAFDTNIEVFSGTCAAPVDVACNADGAGCAGFTSFVAPFPVTLGTAYLIRVSGFDAGTGIGIMDMDVNFSSTSPPTDLVCTLEANGDVTVTWNNGAPNGDYSAINIYVDGLLNASPAATGGAGSAETFTLSGLAAGASYEICVEGVATGTGALSVQVCCTVFVAQSCPAFDGQLIPVPTLLPFGGCVSCNAGGLHTDNEYLRSFDLCNPPYGVSDNILINCVTTAVNASNATSGSQPIRVRVYIDTNGGAPDDFADLNLIYEEEFDLPDGIANELFNMVMGSGIVDPDVLGLQPTALVGCLGAGESLVVSIFTPDGQASGNGYFMANPDAAQAPVENGPSYIFAPGCGLTSPVPVASIGFPNDKYILDIGYTDAGDCTCVGGIANLSCAQTPGATTVDLAWDNIGFAGTIEIEVDGNIEYSGPPITSFTTSALPAYTTVPIFVSAVTVNFRSCNVNVAPAHSWAEGALAIGVGATPYDITNAVLETGMDLDPAVCDPNTGLFNLYNDLFYCYTAGTTGDVLVSTCGSGGFDSILAVYEDTGMPCGLGDPLNVIACNDDNAIAAGGSNPGTPSSGANCGGLEAELIFVATAGQQYLIRLGAFNPAGLGAGDLVVNDCIAPQNVTAAVDCTTGNVNLAWTNAGVYLPVNGIEILRDGVSIAMLPGGDMAYTDLAVADGDYDYTVRGDCGSGPNDAEIFTSVLTYAGYTDLVFAMEGLQSVPFFPGAVDGGPAITAALNTAGRTAGMVRIPVDEYPCINDPQVEGVWVLLGTLGPIVGGPGYRLTSAQGDLLHDLVQVDGKRLYFESADQVGFDHNATLLDSIDGFDNSQIDTAAADGDDTFTSGDGLDGGLGIDLSAFADSPYTQDDPVGDDFTDVLFEDPLDTGITGVGVLMVIDDALALPSYNTMLHTTTTGGSQMVYSSVEIGGLSTATDGIVSTIVGGFYSTGLPDFRRGDCNADGGFNIADAVFLLATLFSGGPAGPCSDACDINDDGGTNIADAIYGLATLFSGGPPPPAPGPSTCGPDATDTDALDCASYPPAC